MHRLYLVFLTIAASLFVGGAVAQTKPPDWKLFGFATVGDVPQVLFYAKNEIRQNPSGTLEVWTKGLSDKEMKAAQDSPKEELIESAANKVLVGYTLPYSRIQELDEDQRIALMLSEEIANTGEIAPKSRILYELDCSKRKIRELSIKIEIGGKTGNKETPSEWKPVAPGTTATALLILICPA